MTWNLEWFFDDQAGDNYSKLGKEKTSSDRARWDKRRDAFAARIAEAHPSVLAVQEVENRRVLWYLTRALTRNHGMEYHELGVEGRDHYTEQDVGFLIRPPVDVLQIIQGGYPKRMRSTNQFYDLTKHLMALLEVQHGDQFEQVFVINVHLRAGEQGEPFRLRQARLLHHWVADAVAAGKNVIALGDFNTEERGETIQPGSDIGIATGKETPSVEDDLIDLNLRLPKSDRQTHLLPEREFDRILVSPSLLEDAPGRPDLVFKKIEVRRDLAIRGPADTPEQHWDGVWEPGEENLDLSDHYPVIATFEVK
ncbi:MAG: endonuclease/exonuclease/phosphatase family protein [Rubripirellula sp.]